MLKKIKWSKKDRRRLKAYQLSLGLQDLSLKRNQQMISCLERKRLTKTNKLSSNSEMLKTLKLALS